MKYTIKYDSQFRPNGSKTKLYAGTIRQMNNATDILRVEFDDLPSGFTPYLNVARYATDKSLIDTTPSNIIFDGVDGGYEKTLIQWYSEIAGFIDVSVTLLGAEVEVDGEMTYERIECGVFYFNIEAVVVSTGTVEPLPPLEDESLSKVDKNLSAYPEVITLSENAYTYLYNDGIYQKIGVLNEGVSGNVDLLTKGTIDAKLDLKADTSTVNTALALKANKSDVNTALGLKADKTTVASDLALKVDKVLTIIGLDLQDDILLGEFKIALGNATQTFDGLMSNEDKSHLDNLVALLNTDDANDVVNTIGEILEIFQNFPEGAYMLDVLATKVDKEAGKTLSTNDLTDILKDHYDTAYAHSQTKDDNPHETTYAQLLNKPTTIEQAGILNVYNKEYIDALKEQNGWESELITQTPLLNGQTISTAVLRTFDSLKLQVRNTATNMVDTDIVETSIGVITGYKIKLYDTTIYLEIGETNSTFVADLNWQLVIVGLVYKDSDEIIHLQNEVIDHEQRIDSIEAIIRKQDSDIASVDDDGIGIMHIGKDVAETTVTTKIDGLLLDAEQLVTNPFDSVWQNAGSNIYYYGGYRYFTATNQYGWVGTQNVQFTLGQKYYINSSKLLNLSYPNLYLQIGISAKEIVPNINETMYSTIWVSDTNDNTHIGFMDVSSSNWQVSAFDSFNLFNISTLIANKQYSPLYSTTFDLMSDAQIKAQIDLWVQNGTLPNSIQAVDMDKRVTSVGKNLFDKSKLIEDGVSITTGILGGFPGQYATEMISIKPSTQYRRSGFIGDDQLKYVYYDINKVFISGQQIVGEITTPSNAYYLRLSFNIVSNINIGQFEQGSVATTYEPYRSSSMYLDAGGEVGYSYQGTRDTIEFRNGQALFIDRVNDTQDGLRTTPIETPISVIGNAMAYPNCTVLIEDVVRRSGVYSSGITVDKTISKLDNIYKLNDDGSSTKLLPSGATVSGDGLSFTHTSLSNGDFVWLDYYYQGTNVKGLSTVYYYGDKMIVSGSGTTSGKVYKIVPTVVDENIVWTKVEV